MMIKIIHNAETNEILEIPLNEKEISERLAFIELNDKVEMQNKTAKTMLLEKLGITEDEAKLLLS